MIEIINGVKCEFAKRSNVVIVDGNKSYLHSVVWDEVEPQHIEEVKAQLDKQVKEKIAPISTKKNSKNGGNK